MATNSIKPLDWSKKSKEEYKNFFSRFETWLRVEGIDYENETINIKTGRSDSHKARDLLKLYGGEKIEEVFSTVNDFEFLSYNQAKEILGQNLKTNTSIKQSIMDFCTLKPKAGETLSDFISRLQRAARECDEKNENMIIVQIALRYPDNDVVRKAMEKETTISKLLEWDSSRYIPSRPGTSQALISGNLNNNPIPKPKPNPKRPCPSDDITDKDDTSDDDDQFINIDNADVKLLHLCEVKWIKKWCGRKDFSKQRCIYLGCSQPAKNVACYKLRDKRKEFIAPICSIDSQDTRNFANYQETKSNIDYLIKRK